METDWQNPSPAKDSNMESIATTWRKSQSIGSINTTGGKGKSCWINCRISKLKSTDWTFISFMPRATTMENTTSLDLYFSSMGGHHPSLSFRNLFPSWRIRKMKILTSRWDHILKKSYVDFSNCCEHMFRVSDKYCCEQKRCEGAEHIRLVRRYVVR